jgi:hypothetical protein
MSEFESLIKELGTILGVSLQAENDSICKLLIKEQLQLQIESDEAAERIILACFISEIPPGGFREEVFATALKANFLDQSLGGFSYEDSTRSLVLQLYLPIAIAAPLLATLIQQFTDKALDWKSAIEQGDISRLIPGGTSSLPSPMNLS